jgi:hypothetical protein
VAHLYRVITLLSKATLLDIIVQVRITEWLLFHRLSNIRRIMRYYVTRYYCPFQNIMCSTALWITQEHNQLEICSFHQSIEETGACVLLQYCIRRNHFRINHFYRTLQKKYKKVCHADEISTKSKKICLKIEINP